jgi:hypothetical protein
MAVAAHHSTRRGGTGKKWNKWNKWNKWKCVSAQVGKCDRDYPMTSGLNPPVALIDFATSILSLFPLLPLLPLFHFFHFFHFFHM